MATGFTSGLTADSFQDTGRTTTCMVRVNILGQMEGVTRVTMKMIKNMDKEFTLGLMVGNMTDNGSSASSMAKVNIAMLMVTLDEALGLKVKDKCGWMNDYFLFNLDLWLINSGLYLLAKLVLFSL